ncbi:MAG: hypothetical protein C4K58_01660 [Flavobacteriaceae bacterium]|nr:MAG: hypothetical protein C4K58_01660 [Flavobacteriaceae bacterium]
MKKIYLTSLIVGLLMHSCKQDEYIHPPSQSIDKLVSSREIDPCLTVDQEPKNEASKYNTRGVSSFEVKKFVRGEKNSTDTSTVLHEFGHVLGLVHEQLSPKFNGCLVRDKVYKYFYDNQNWDKDKVDVQIFNKISEPMLVASTDYDERSIMHYYFPGSITCNGLPIGGASVISPKDVEIIRLIYLDYYKWSKYGNAVGLVRLSKGSSYLINTTISEVNKSIANGYKVEKIMGYSPISSRKDTTPFYSLYNPKIGAYFYSSDLNEANLAISRGYTLRNNNMGHVFIYKIANTEGISRFYDKKSNTYYYSYDIQDIRLAQSKGLYYENTIGYVYNQ